MYLIERARGFIKEKNACPKFFGGIALWIWLVAGCIFVYLLILFNHKTTDERDKPQKNKPTHIQLEEMDESYMEFFDAEDELLEEFLIIDLLDEEEEEF